MDPAACHKCHRNTGGSVIPVVHGMAEHLKCYRHAFLSKNGKKRVLHRHLAHMDLFAIKICPGLIRRIKLIKIRQISFLEVLRDKFSND